MEAQNSEKILYLSEKILESIKFSARAHYTQTRRDTAATPFISHPAAVGMILARAGFEEDVIAAGFLHDVIEDTPYTHKDIEHSFGAYVADLVSWVSYDQALPVAEGKAQYLKQLAEAPSAAAAISAADLIANRVDVLLKLNSGEPVWVGKGIAQKAMAHDIRRMATIKQKLDHPLVATAEQTVQKVHSYFTVSDT